MNLMRNLISLLKQALSLQQPAGIVLKKNAHVKIIWPCHDTGAVEKKPEIASLDVECI